MRADQLHLAGIQGAFGLDNAALLAHSSGAHMLDDIVAAFHNQFAFAGAHGQYLALLAAVSAAEDGDGVTGFYMNFWIHLVNTSHYSTSGARLRIFI